MAVDLLKCGQINLQGSAVVTVEIVKIAYEYGTEVLLFQEPYDDEPIIDVTLVTIQTRRKVSSWEVLEDSLSDYRLILNDISMEDIPEHVASDLNPLYIHKDANWRRFGDILKAKVEMLLGIEYPQDRVEETTSAILTVCDQALKEVTTQTPTNRGWDEEIESFRKGARQLRRK
ncbi:hypothetical protein PR048_017237 [Dryococelus australis]|uniref:Uncharacterized protein n=1 Tax=Dryococelus australis TaxID=614101 RepID=A0ABQ9H939_9NEOP|nr:hypothetical protein PR048_017237 [Dryococelus australis]